MKGVTTYSILMGVITLLSAVASFFRSLCFSVISERISKNLSNDVYASLVHKDVSFFDEKKIGEFLSRLSSDITIIKNGLGVNVALMIRTLIGLIIILIILFVISWKLTLVMLGSMLPILLFIQIYARYEKRLVKQSQEKKADSSVVAEECFANCRTVKAFAMEHKEQQKYQHQNNLIFLIGHKRAWLYGGFSMVLTIFLYGAMAVVIWYGALLVDQ